MPEGEVSRFQGWTMKDVRNLSYVDKAQKVKAKTKASPDYVGKICSALTVLKIKHVREYKFLHDRRFRFDIAIPKHRIAIEFEGGVWSRGRHVRGKGYISDVKKYNLATMHGWKLLRYTTEDTKSDMWEYRIADEILELTSKEQ